MYTNKHQPGDHYRVISEIKYNDLFSVTGDIYKVEVEDDGVHSMDFLSKLPSSKWPDILKKNLDAHLISPILFVPVCT